MTASLNPCPKCNYRLTPEPEDTKDNYCIMCGKVVYFNPHESGAPLAENEEFRNVPYAAKYQNLRGKHLKKEVWG